MLTFRPTASGPLVAFVALLSLPLYIPGSYAQSQLPACAVPCAVSAAATAGCSLADSACICSSDPFIGAYTTCIYQPENCLNGDTADIQPAISFYVIACEGEPGPGFSTIAAPSSTTGLGGFSIPNTTLTFPGSVLPTTTRTRTSSTSTPGSTSASTQTVSSPPANAAASLPIHAHAAAALMAGGIGALVAVVV